MIHPSDPSKGQVRVEFSIQAVSAAGGADTKRLHSGALVFSGR